MNNYSRLHNPRPSLIAGANGYSLIELVTVVAIAGILSALSVSYISEIYRGQIVLQNLENMRSWLEATRRASLRGQPCLVSVSTNNLKDLSTVLESSPVITSGTSLQSNPCGSPTEVQLTSPYKNLRYALTVTSSGETVNSFTYTPRGTLFKDNIAYAFPGDIIYVLKIVNTSGVALSSPYCMRVSGFLGSVQSIGSQNCS
jgi:prepilin-type N-terminal cleavage/methylation domain-containing protein